jgi:hypothetical protein
MKKLRIFNNRQYSLHGIHEKKSFARAKAKELRDMGFISRVVKYNRIYYIYILKTQKKIKIPYNPGSYVKFIYRIFGKSSSWWIIACIIFIFFILAVIMDLSGFILPCNIFLFTGCGILAMVVFSGLIAISIKNCYLRRLSRKYGIPLDELYV